MSRQNITERPGKKIGLEIGRKGGWTDRWMEEGMEGREGVERDEEDSPSKTMEGKIKGNKDGERRG